MSPYFSMACHGGAKLWTNHIGLSANGGQTEGAAGEFLPQIFPALSYMRLFLPVAASMDHC